MNPEDLPKGQSGEMASLDGRKPQHKAGVWRHEPTGKEVIVLHDPTTTAKQDALHRVGFTWVAPPPTPLELRNMQQAQLEKDQAAEAAGEVPEPYLVPGEQSQVFNGTVTDVNGPGDTLAAKDAEIAALRTQLQEANAPAAPVEAETPAEEVAEPAEEPAPVEPAPEEASAAEEAPAEAPAESVPEAPAEDAAPAEENKTNKEGK